MGVDGVVLIVDDEESVRAYEASLVAHLGLTALTAPDSEVALSLLAEHRVDVVVADICMPGNEDLGFVRTLHERYPGLPVLLVTGQPSFESARSAIGLGVRAYLLKPFTTEQLANELRAALDLRRMHQALVDTRRHLEASLELVRQAEASLVADPTAPPSRGAFTEILLAQVVTATADLCRSLTDRHEGGAPAPAPLGLRDLVGALRETVEVLDRTKQHFRSKELGQLRHRLEDVLGRLP